eukprot:1229396-Alexandrium_andersonii.AAC.1
MWAAPASLHVGVGGGLWRTELIDEALYQGECLSTLVFANALEQALELVAVQAGCDELRAKG